MCLNVKKHTFPEPQITAHSCPDKIFDQILNCSDVLEYGPNLVQFHFTNDKIVKYVMKPKAH